tara:strand:+ start:87 stop:590 length:504 start_codon:yes stop_codon:yes gene_type:complete
MASLTLRKKGKDLFKKDDDYTTPKYIWNMLDGIIDKEKIVYDPFYNKGETKIYLEELGYKNIIHNKEDFYINHQKYEFDIILTNPPYSNKKKVFNELKKIDKPFIIIVPVATITKQFIRKTFLDKLQMIIPSKRMQFEKNGINNKRCWFDCVFLTYKINLPKSITFL